MSDYCINSMSLGDGDKEPRVVVDLHSVREAVASYKIMSPPIPCINISFKDGTHHSVQYGSERNRDAELAFLQWKLEELK